MKNRRFSTIPAADAARAAFDALAKAPPTERGLAVATDTFRRAIIDLGLGTKDNRSALGKIKYGRTLLERKYPRLCLRLARRSIDIDDIFLELEGAGIPPRVVAKFPKLTQGEWEAAMRLAIMILQSVIQAPVADPDGACPDFRGSIGRGIQ